ncbi:MAG: competence protein CoiA family protein [Bacteroidota bacterium]|nr:competence protein CoiA family protein [Bacteroidota bacterium]
MDIKLPYGLENGELVSIDDVENGLACNCVCPNCGETLIARKGNIREHHFAHYKSDDCGWTGESVIHKIAKEIIANSRTIKLPNLIWSYNPVIAIYGERTILIDNVKLEQKIGSIIPDIIIETKGRELLVEIKVSHGIDRNKFLKIKKLDIPTIEIDVKELVSSLFKKGDYFLRSASFEEALIDSDKNKYWIYNTEKERFKGIFKERYAIIRFVEHLKSKYFDLYYVDDCPIEKRKWKSGYREGQSYASVDDDCRLCKYNLGYDMHQIEGAVTKRILFEQEGIYCIGHLSGEGEWKIKSVLFHNMKKLPDIDQIE